MGVSSRYIGFIAILVLIILVSGCISKDEISNNNISINKSNNMYVKTYSTDDFSFQYPSNWHLNSYESYGNITQVSKDPYIIFDLPNFSFQLSPSPGSPLFQVQKVPGYVASPSLSNQSNINQILSENSVYEDDLGEKISNNTVIIDNETVIEETFIDRTPYFELIRFKVLYLFKNRNTYIILIQASDKDFYKEEKNFEIILNSFKFN